MVYIDECGLDETIRREYARSPKGQRVAGEVTGKKTERLSIIAGLVVGKPVAPLYFSGYCDTLVVLAWVEHELLPKLRPGMVLVWDNASFHKSPAMKEMIEAAGCQLLFLPPYSPHLNKIEQWWAVLKAKIRRIKTHLMPLTQALQKIFETDHKC